jgi:hypothetical protein
VNKEEIENLKFTLAFKGKQQYNEISKIKYNEAKKFEKQIIKYYETMKDEMESNPKNLKIPRKK